MASRNSHSRAESGVSGGRDVWGFVKIERKSDEGAELTKGGAQRVGVR